MFAIPTLPELIDRARMAFRANLAGSDAWLWPNNVNPSAKVIAGSVYETFGFADYVQRQKFALTADSDNLDLHGAELGIARKPAAPAAGLVTLTVEAAIQVVEGALFRRSDGVQFVATTALSIAGAGTLDVPVQATSNGKITNTIAGTALTIISGVSDIAAAANPVAAVASGGLTLGVDVEPDGEPFTSDLSTYRGRILFRKRNVPFGGAPADYVQWAGAVSGVTRVYVERIWAGSGTVRVFPLFDDLHPDTNGIPTAGDLARVSDYLATVQPGDAIVTVAAAAAVPVDITIEDLVPDTLPVREAILAELRATFRRASAVAGSDTPHPSMPYLAVPTSFALIWIAQAVADASGVIRATVTAPVADVALTGGQMATLGDVTFA